jgi:hypothetical protein
MHRRDFIKVIAGSAIGWPLAVRAQQAERMRRVGVLMSLAADDQEGQARVGAFVQGLRELGWIDGRNVQIDIRWAAGGDRVRQKYAAELVALSPDVMLASGGSVVAPLLQVTRAVLSCSRRPLIRLALDSSITLPVQAAMRRDFQFLTTALRGNGWSCSSRLHRAYPASQSFGIPQLHRGSVSSRLYTPSRRRLGWM